MTGMGIIALDLGLRGAAAGVFLMLVVVILVRVRPHTAVTLLGAALAACGAAYSDRHRAPFVPKSTLWWTLPILAGNPVFFWLWVRAAFDDDFVRSAPARCLVADRCLHRLLVSLAGPSGRPRTSRRPVDLAGGAGVGAFSCRADGQDLECRPGRRAAPVAARNPDLVAAVYWRLAGPDLMSTSSASFSIAGVSFRKPSQRDGLLTLAVWRMESVLSAAGHPRSLRRQSMLPPSRQ